MDGMKVDGGGVQFLLSTTVVLYSKIYWSMLKTLVENAWSRWTRFGMIHRTARSWINWMKPDFVVDMTLTGLFLNGSIED